MKKSIDYNNIPKHIAIIMDGNGRWAKKRFLTKLAGHKAGAMALKKLAQDAEDLGVKYMTVYAFSTENWKREKSEIEDLMNLLREYIQTYIDDSNKNNMKISVIGDCSMLDRGLQERIVYLQDLTKDKEGLNIIIAINYGGRDEILRAVKKLGKDVLNNKINVDTVTEDTISSYLDTREVPDPELLIRTSGEFRLSNFLLWQSAYTEFYFTDKLWPDFNIKDLKEAILSFQNRDRRFGGR